MSESSKARRGRFLELGGVVPAEGEGAALLEAILGSGEFLPRAALRRRTGAGPARPPIRTCGGPKPAEVIEAEVRTAAVGARDFADLQRRLRVRPALRDPAARRARARLGDDRGGGPRAVGVRRRLPRRGGRVLRRRADPRARPAARRQRRPGPVRGDGDGEAGGRGAELLVGHRRLLLLLDRRRCRGDLGPADAAPLLCRALAPGDRRDRGADRRRDDLPRRSAAAAGGTKRADLQRAAGGRALLRDVRTHLGAAGLAARSLGGRRSRARRRAAGRARSVHLSRATSIRGWSRRCVGCGRCSAIRPTRPARSATPGSTSSSARAASATWRWWCRRCSSCTPASVPTCASGTRRARCPACWWRGCSGRARRRRCSAPIDFGAGSSTGCRWPPGRSATGCRRTIRRGRRSRAAWGSPIWPPSTPRSPPPGRRWRRSRRRWASRRPRRTWRRRACSIRCAAARSWSDGSRRPASATSRWRPTPWSWSGRGCRWCSSRRRSPRPIPTARWRTFAISRCAARSA